MKKITCKILILLFLLFNLFINVAYAENPNTKKLDINLKTEKIKTENVSMNTYIDRFEEDYKILDKNEVEEKFTLVANKSFSELANIKFNHENKKVTLEFLINEDDGNVNSLISTSIYNFLKGTKEIINYAIDFEAIVRYTDSNGRYLKKPLYRYSYETENLIFFDWKNMSFSEITSLCNEIYSYETDEITKMNKSKEDNIQVKVINILKYYIGEKVNSKKDLAES